MQQKELIDRINALFGNSSGTRIRLTEPAYRTDEVVYVTVQPVFDLKDEDRIHFMVTVIIPELVGAVCGDIFSVLKHTLFTLRSSRGGICSLLRAVLWRALYAVFGCGKS